MTQSRIYKGKFKARIERDTKELSGSQEKKRKDPEESCGSHFLFHSSMRKNDKDSKFEPEEQLESSKKGPLEYYQYGGPHKMRYCGLPLVQPPPYQLSVQIVERETIWPRIVGLHQRQ